MMWSRSRTCVIVSLGLALISGTASAVPADGKPQATAALGADKAKNPAGGKPAEAQKDPARDRLDAALRLLKSEAYPAAAAALYEYLEAEKKFEDEARYNLAKALYRMGLYHSAMSWFSEILAKGPSNRYYGASLEWCLFISRKIEGDDRILESIARYTTLEFPKEYRDEFLFHLSRFHYARAVRAETSAIAATLGETKVKETITGGKSFEGDIFGDDGGGEAAPPEPAVKKKEGGGLSVDADLFGSDEDVKKSSPKNDKNDKGKKDKGKKDKGTKPEPATPAPAPAEEAKAEKGKVKEDPGQLTSKEHMDLAARLVAQVNPESRFGPKAKFLEGLVFYKLGRENDALDAFKAVVRLTRAGQPMADDKLRELAFFQLARTHFGAKQPSYSIFYYDKIDQDSYAWLDAIYESSWAEFRLGNFEKALGNLLTLHSPFFKDEYYPESHILKAVIYYENCRYPETNDILAEFQKKYEPVRAELAKLTERDLAPAKYYEILANLRGQGAADPESNKSTIVGQILAIALADNELRRLDGAFREVDTEFKAFSVQGGGFGATKLGTKLGADLGRVRDELARDAGRAVKRTLERERDAIRLLIEQSVRIKIETSRAEQERIEGTLQGKQTAPKDRDREFIEWTNDERLVWPFVGEYWRDELGTYQLTLAHSCQTQVREAQ